MKLSHSGLLGLALISAMGLGSLSAASAASVTYTYDAAGHLVDITYDSGASIDYIYDKADNRISEDKTAN